MAIEDITSEDMFAEADRLGREAALLEGFADARYDDSARLYTGGSSTFVLSLDTADGYRKEARELRGQACEFRKVAAFMAEQEKTPPGPARGDDGFRREPTWQQKLNDARNS